MKNRAVLVTGAAGCIGAWAVKLLTDIGTKPVVYDLTENRSRLELIMDRASDVIWERGDISDFQGLMDVINKHEVTAIIHLAALQVPFCKADPVGSTRVNVMGSINVLEAARQAGIRRLTYASSVAAPAMGDNDYLATLYGAHKICGEQMAAVYWQDWQVPSLGIRPGIIYGPGRDQGMSAAPSIAMLAAIERKSYTIPFSGPLTFCHVEDAALRFVTAISEDQTGAPVFEMNGTPADTKVIVEMIKSQVSGANIEFSGGAMPFPAQVDNGGLDAALGVAKYRSLKDGIAQTLSEFRDAKARGFDTSGLLARLTEVS
jgi:nucleoside-diphosphate-sugar epimerase